MVHVIVIEERSASGMMGVGLTAYMQDRIKRAVEEELRSIGLHPGADVNVGMAANFGITPQGIKP